MTKHVIEAQKYGDLQEHRQATGEGVEALLTLQRHRFALLSGPVVLVLLLDLVELWRHLLHATLEVPTPGYSYNFSTDDSDAQGGILAVNINLQTPEAATSQVISTLTVDRQIATTADINTVNISIDKEFDWGPEKASCSTPVTEEGTTK